MIKHDQSSQRTESNSSTTDVSRRTVLKLGAAGLAGFVLPSISLGNEKAGANAGPARRAKLTGLLQNEDCTDFFYYQDFPAGKAG